MDTFNSRTKSAATPEACDFSHERFTETDSIIKLKKVYTFANCVEKTQETEVFLQKED